MDFIKKTVENWENLKKNGRLDNEYWINKFIEEHEGVFMSFGLFVKGIRVAKPEKVDVFHTTINGVLGILSMNIEILKNKLL